MLVVLWELAERLFGPVGKILDIAVQHRKKAQVDIDAECVRAPTDSDTHLKVTVTNISDERIYDGMIKIYITDPTLPRIWSLDALLVSWENRQGKWLKRVYESKTSPRKLYYIQRDKSFRLAPGESITVQEANHGLDSFVRQMYNLREEDEETGAQLERGGPVSIGAHIDVLYRTPSRTTSKPARVRQGFWFSQSRERLADMSLAWHIDKSRPPYAS